MSYSKGFRSIQSEAQANKALKDITISQETAAELLIQKTAAMSIRERKAYIAGVLDVLAMNHQLQRMPPATKDDYEFIAAVTIGVYAGAMKLVLKHYGMEHQ